MNFGEALSHLKKGKKLAREGWNGRGMFVVYQKGYPEGIPCNQQTAKAWGMKEGELFQCKPYLQIKNVDESHSMWVPSIGDCLAEDWLVRLQQELNDQFGAGLTLDGIAGSRTLAACPTVKRYQKQRGLAADGIVGKGTWKELLGL